MNCRLLHLSLLILPLVMVLSCNRQDTAVPGASYDPARDYFTFSNHEQFSTRHLALELAVDFENERLGGSVTLFMNRTDPAARSITLDIRDIEISGARFSSHEGHWQDAEFSVGKRHQILGQPLSVMLPEGFDPAEEFRLEIVYRTDPRATALQWLKPELTAGGEHPFMFSQSQSIHARSWIPLQDTPGMRITYEAVIRAPERLLVLMSADNDPMAPRSGEYRFEMPQPIPSYLMAIAVGNVFFAPIGEQTGIYAEPEMLSAAAWEFGETQEMLERVAEKYGSYQWGRYDLLILPPSFPYGGMENPRLSFITPSILAGDRSLTALIAHELAHSWSGNLVTNRTWRDIWLNEGITSYLDARVMEMLYGPERAAEERYLSYTSLLEEFKYVSPPMQALAPELWKEDPDEAQGSTYYAKGQFLLEHLENRFGRDRFDGFLSGYFEHFAWQSITTEQFLAYLDEHLLQADPGQFTLAQVMEWVEQPGLPAYVEIPEPETLVRAGAAARAFAAGDISAVEIPAGEWSPHAVINLVNELPADIGSEKLDELDGALGLSVTRNVAIGRAWFAQVARKRHLPAYEKMEQYLNRHGRTWLLRGVYRSLMENGQDAGLAREIFENARAKYHPITILAIEPLLAAD